MDFYQVLGVDRSASQDDIKKAYRKLASKHHPDKGGDNAKFQEIQSAYSTLSDPQKRHQYDHGGHKNTFNNGDFSEMDIGDIFRHFNFGFSHHPGGPAHDPFSQFRQPRRNKDLRITVPITLEETLADQHKAISVMTTNNDRSNVDVVVPRGVTSGTTIKYSGLGDNLFNSLPRGDLYVEFFIKQHERFRVNGTDLETDLKISAWDAMTGCKVLVNGLDRAQFELSIPAGTQPGAKLRIRENGLFQLKSDVRGNLIITVNVDIPKLTKSDELDQLIAAVKATQ